MALTPGFLRRVRTPNRRSCSKVSIRFSAQVFALGLKARKRDSDGEAEPLFATIADIWLDRLLLTLLDNHSGQFIFSSSCLVKRVMNDLGGSRAGTQSGVSERENTGCQDDGPGRREQKGKIGVRHRPRKREGEGLEYCHRKHHQTHDPPQHSLVSLRLDERENDDVSQSATQPNEDQDRARPDELRRITQHRKAKPKYESNPNNQPTLSALKLDRSRDEHPREHSAAKGRHHPSKRGSASFDCKSLFCQRSKAYGGRTYE